MAAKKITFWLIALIVFVLDRLSKFWIVSNVPFGSSIDFSFLSITYILNAGTLFGMFKHAALFFLIFSLVVIVFLVLKFDSFDLRIQPFLGLVLGGALGNVVDRLLYGAVVDFIDVHFWPVFNVADAALSVAVVLILVFELFFNQEPKKYQKHKRNI
ncbi:signal peptidase II [Candidatus Woesearchaeota archaeon CG10_big_fil_rev_8_21_14_0_10_37_12]|nr:MAG: signal peptidase II [Candidatus Woesearchaeota archaeon CG10_big_fil_rev_8_21_14_0_10_37_12]